MEFLAPPSACTRLPVAIAREATYWATVADPTNETASTPVRVEQGLHGVVGAVDQVRRRRAGWRRCPAISSTMRSGASGSCSEGFSTIVLPQTIA